MIGFFPFVVALISVPFWFLYNCIAIKMNEKNKGDSREMPNVERPNNVDRGASYFKRDQ